MIGRAQGDLDAKPEWLEIGLTLPAKLSCGYENRFPWHSASSNILPESCRFRGIQDDVVHLADLEQLPCHTYNHVKQKEPWALGVLGAGSRGQSANCDRNSGSIEAPHGPEERRILGIP